MILNALEVLKNELGGTDVAVIDDIAKADTDNPINDKIVITLVNVVEEAAMKNTSRLEPIVPNATHGPYKRMSPAAYLNLYVMITASRNLGYSGALDSLSDIIEHFQTKNVLISPATPGSPGIPARPEFEFTIHLHSLPFEQLSYAWGLLGGKIMPSALYKLSIVKIQKAAVDLNLGYIHDVDVAAQNGATPPPPVAPNP